MNDLHLRRFILFTTALALCAVAPAQGPPSPAKGWIVAITQCAVSQHLGRKPGYIIELNDPVHYFLARNAPIELWIGVKNFEIGGQKLGDPHSLRFLLTQSEFASLKTGDHVTLSYGLPDLASLRSGVNTSDPEWDFGALDKGIVGHVKQCCSFPEVELCHPHPVAAETY